MDDTVRTADLAIPKPFSAVEPTLEAIRGGYPSVKTIKTPEQFSVAGELLKMVKGALKQIEEQRVAITKPMNESLRAANAQAKAAAEPFERAETAIKLSMANYQAEVERQRREAQRKADEEARKEREKLERQAAKAAASGKEEKAAELEQRAAEVVPLIGQPAAPAKVEGVTFREAWKYEITDAAQLPREYLIPDESAIGKVVRALKGNARIPGVRVYCEKTVAAGAA